MKNSYIGQQSFEPQREVLLTSLRDRVICYGEEFLGIPYVFGQRSIHGLDCVGFLYQISLKMEWQINYPCDYNDPAQFKITETLDKYFTVAEAGQKGDIIVVRNQLGNTHHVGLIYSDTQIIHSIDGVNKPGVRIDQIRKFKKLIVKTYDITSFQQI
jgi:cell wall-associated NlpC family hydrolase